MRKWIPRLKQKGFSLKGMGVEMLIGLGVFAITVNTFIIPRIHSMLGIPAMIGIVAFAIILFLPSETNETKTTAEALGIYLHFKLKSSTRAFTNKRTGGFKLKFLDIFNRGKINLNTNIQNNTKKINASALEDSGILDISSNSYTDKSNNEYAVFQYEYKNINGISREIDEENKRSQATLFDSLEIRGKLHFPVYQNRPLEKTRDFFLEILESSSHREEVIEMLHWIDHFNNVTQTIKTIDVHTNDLESFFRNSEHLELKRFENEELVMQLHDRQHGGFNNE